MTGEKNLEGLGGWLILVGIGVIFSLLRIFNNLFPFYLEIFSNGYWELVTTPGTEAYHPLWGPLLIGEIVINIGFVLAWLFIALLFISKDKVFPKCFIGILVLTLAFILVDALVAVAILPNEPVFDQEFGRSLMAVVIWVPYMLVSKRVKATFVK